MRRSLATRYVNSLHHRAADDSPCADAEKSNFELRDFGIKRRYYPEAACSLVARPDPN